MFNTATLGLPANKFLLETSSQSSAAETASCSTKQTGNTGDRFCGRQIDSVQLADLLSQNLKETSNVRKIKNSASTVSYAKTCSFTKNDDFPLEQRKIRPLFVLDFRPASEFECLHIESSINVSLPPILYKRLIRGTLSLSSIVSPSDKQRQEFGSEYKNASIVLVDEYSTTSTGNSALRPNWSYLGDDRGSSHTVECTSQISGARRDKPVSLLLFEKLEEEGCDVAFFEGDLRSFYSHIPRLFRIKSTNSYHLHAIEASPTGSCTTCLSSVKSRSVDIDTDSQIGRVDTVPLFERRRHSDDQRRPTLNLPDMSYLKLAGFTQNAAVIDDTRSSLASLTSSGFGGSVTTTTSTSGRTALTSSSSALTSVSSPIDDVDVALLNEADRQDEYPSQENFVGYTYAELEKEHISYRNHSAEHHPLPVDYRFPVEIIPGLFLGNSTNATDREMLLKYNIKYILNVTPDLPNVFEEDPDFHYLQLPILDHWSQDLLVHFPAAISFIDSARQNNYGVLVHCLAGISRSVTVTVAYLMRTLFLTLEDAYDLVKDHKPNIAPNLNFMGQLLDFQRHLFGENLPSGALRQQRAPPKCGVDDRSVSSTASLTSAATSSAMALGAPPPGRRRDNGRCAERCC